MKKIVSIILALLLGFTFVGTNIGSTTPSASSNTTANTKINDQFIEDLVKGFETKKFPLTFPKYFSDSIAVVSLSSNNGNILSVNDFMEITMNILNRTTMDNIVVSTKMEGNKLFYKLDYTYVTVDQYGKTKNVTVNLFFIESNGKVREVFIP
jgi:hypothetical protein